MKIFPRRKVEVTWRDLIGMFKDGLSAERRREVLVYDFEKKFAGYIGAEYAASVPSARLGLSVLLDCLGLKNGDEVILSAFNYHVIPALIKLKGFEPVFVDIDKNSLNIDPDSIEKAITPRTRCVIATHMFGKTCDIERIKRICDERKLVLIEDAAHACGAEYKGRKLGTFGEAALFSFGTGKSLVAFGGGMIVSKNEVLFKRINTVLQETVRSECNGWNRRFFSSLIEVILTNNPVFTLLVFPALYVLSYIDPHFIDRAIEDKGVLEDGKVPSKQCAFSWQQASLGMSQLAKLEGMNERRIFLAMLWNDLLKDVEEIITPAVGNDKDHISLYYNIKAENADELRKFLLKHGVDTKRDGMKICTGLGFFEKRKACPTAEKFAGGRIELPCYPSLSIEDIYHQADLIKKFYGKDKV